jgi:hypothetical protein
MKPPKFAFFVLCALACGSPNPGLAPASPTRSTLRVVSSEEAEFIIEENPVSTTLSASPTEVWAVLPDAYRSLGIPVSEVAQNVLTLGNADFESRQIDGKRMGSFFDCGVSRSGIVANLYDVSISIATRLQEAPGGGTVVTTTMEAWARPRTTSGNPVHCSSKQTLERRLTEELSALLGPGSPASEADPSLQGKGR